MFIAFYLQKYLQNKSWFLYGIWLYYAKREIPVSKTKKIKIMQKVEQGEMFKTLREWAEEGLLFDQLPDFLSFCGEENHKATDVVSYVEFLTLKEKFEA